MDTVIYLFQTCQLDKERRQQWLRGELQLEGAWECLHGPSKLATEREGSGDAPKRVSNFDFTPGAGKRGRCQEHSDTGCLRQEQRLPFPCETDEAEGMAGEHWIWWPELRAKDLRLKIGFPGLNLSKWEIFSSSTWEPEPRRRKVGSWPGEEQEWVKYADG